MMKRILTIAVLGAAFLANTGCNSGDSFKKYKGIEYKIVKDVPGTNAKVGDIIEFHILAKCDTLVLGDSRKDNGGKPAIMPLQETTESAQFQSVFQFLSQGDSAVVKISCDTMLAIIKKTHPNQQQLPPWLKSGKNVTVYISMVSVKTKADFDKETQAKNAQAIQADDKTLQDYFAKNSIKPEKTASGLYYTIQKEGTGEKIGRGQSATLKYTGKLLDGTTFDSNVDKTEPFTVKAGTGSVIPGFDEGIMLLKKGTKATLYIPSAMAYGEHSPAPSMPPNSILIFELEVTDVK